jgi:hypothetical protein
VFRKEWGFDSLHGHHRSILAAGCFGTYEKYWRITLKDLLNYRSAIVVDVAKDVVLRAPERIGRDSIHVTDLTPMLRRAGSRYTTKERVITQELPAVLPMGVVRHTREASTSLG